MKRLYDEATRQKALRLWRDGKTGREISEALGVSKTRAEVWAREAGLQRPRPPLFRVHSERTRAEAVRLYISGRSADWVADVVGDGYNKTAVLRWVRKAGHATRPLRTIDRAKVREYRAQGMSHQKIADALGYSARGVAYVLQEAP